MNIKELEQDHKKLVALKSKLIVEIFKAECALEKSFISNVGTNDKANNLALLNTKAKALDKAIDDNYQAIQQAELDEVTAKQDVIITKRKQAVIDALRANDSAIKLSEKLAEQIRIFNENVVFAQTDSTEFITQPRSIIGRLANEFKLYGALANASVMPLLSIDDAERIQSKIK